jgi:ABC-type bacteriocin/lantibiotic exporter with double-glycine peptidase domain
MKDILLPIKPIKQIPLYCGPASLELVLNYYGFPYINQKIIGRDLRVRAHRGCYTQEVINYLKRYNIIAEKSNHIEDLKLIKNGQPIFLGQEDHFMLCIGIKGDKYIFIDPEFGSIRQRKLEWFKENVKDLIIITKTNL